MHRSTRVNRNGLDDDDDDGEAGVVGREADVGTSASVSAMRRRQSSVAPSRAPGLHGPRGGGHDASPAASATAPAANYVDLAVARSSPHPHHHHQQQHRADQRHGPMHR